MTSVETDTTRESLRRLEFGVDSYLVRTEHGQSERVEHSLRAWRRTRLRTFFFYHRKKKEQEIKK